MKFLKIGKRVLIGVTLLATGLFVAYRIGTYHQDIIEYNNVLVKDIVKSELESAIQTVDDVDIGLNVKEAQSGSQIVAEVQNLSSTEEKEHGEVKVAVATKPTEKTSKTSSNKSNKTTSSSNKVTSSKIILQQIRIQVLLQIKTILIVINQQLQIKIQVHQIQPITRTIHRQVTVIKIIPIVPQIMT